MRKIQTSEEFVAARVALGMSAEGAASMLNVTPRTVRYWESGMFKPQSTACRVLEWMLNTGFRPPEFKNRTKFGRKPKGQTDEIGTTAGIRGKS